MPRRSKEEYNAYMNEYMKARYRRRIDTAIEQLGGKCVHCGSVEDLELDHIEPAKKSGTITTIHSFSEKRFQEELSKCQLLCFECHKKKTLIDCNKQSGKDRHGTLSSYRYCKCEICKKAWSAHHKQWREKRKLKLTEPFS